MNLDQLLRFILALSMVAGFLYLAYVLFVSPVEIPEGVRDMANIMLGTLIALVKDVYGFVFGSSSGSKDKQELLNRAIKYEGE